MFVRWRLKCLTKRIREMRSALRGTKGVILFAATLQHGAIVLLMAQEIVFRASNLLRMPMGVRGRGG